MESTTLEYNVERKCDLMQIGGWLDYKSYGIAMPFSRFIQITRASPENTQSLILTQIRHTANRSVELF